MSMPSSRSKGSGRVGVAVSVCLALVLGACSASSNGAHSRVADTSTTAATKAPQGTPLKLALLYNASGTNASVSEKTTGSIAKAWVARTNAAGGVAGHPVSVELQDTKGDVPTGQSIAQALVGDNSVVGVLLADASGESSYAKTLTDGGLPILGGIGYFPTVWGALPNAFGITTTFPAVVNMQIMSAKQVGAKTIGAASCAEVDSCSSAVGFLPRGAKALGLQWAGAVKFAATETSYTAECLQLIGKKADFIQIGGGGPAAIRFTDDCVKQGYTGYFGASAGSVTPDFYTASPTLRLAGALNAFPWWVDAAPVKDFRAAMAANGVAERDYSNPGATATWASLQLFAKALVPSASSAASATRADVIKAYGGIQNETLDGLLAQPTSYTANAPAPKVPCFWVYTYENGKFSGSFTPTCDTIN